MYLPPTPGQALRIQKGQISCFCGVYIPGVRERIIKTYKHIVWPENKQGKGGGKKRVKVNVIFSKRRSHWDDIWTDLKRKSVDRPEGQRRLRPWAQMLCPGLSLNAKDTFALGKGWQRSWSESCSAMNHSWKYPAACSLDGALAWCHAAIPTPEVSSEHALGWGLLWVPGLLCISSIY